MRVNSSCLDLFYQAMHVGLEELFDSSVVQEVDEMTEGLDREVGQAAGGRIAKRVIRHSSGLWPKGIVPWKYHKKLDERGRKEVSTNYVSRNI